jgi:hypothetical protein
MNNIQALRAFFKKCSLLNSGLFILSAASLVLFSEPIIVLHSQWFGLDASVLPVIYFAYLGLYKLFILMFNVVPYFALHCMATHCKFALPDNT